ncbi:MAG: 1,4-dihydroxy-2-naphthoate polyprenyltransferase [Cyclobacteriaceae bacterium]|nr:1,4-dihydroxy-2-naphthoate polyprenyltransferase [Cyclobacteriaceae bacterium]
MSRISVWISAIRLRTLPLALSSIGMGSFLAAFESRMRWPVLLTAALTTIFLQILSNLANDYGDSHHGADNARRSGPSRAVQSGAISPQRMKAAIIVFIILSLIAGLLLLYISFGSLSYGFLALFILGIISIGAALNYTMGKNPYGYAGFGDLFVIIFFGFVGVLGTYFCHVLELNGVAVLPALSCGLLAAAVLNVNNIRDIESDKLAGKQSIPVRIGRKNAAIYHWSLIGLAIAAATLYVILNFQTYYQFFFLVSAPLLIHNAIQVSRRPDAKSLDPMLKQMAISTLVFVITFGIGNLI